MDMERSEVDAMLIELAKNFYELIGYNLSDTATFIINPTACEMRIYQKLNDAEHKLVIRGLLHSNHLNNNYSVSFFRRVIVKEGYDLILDGTVDFRDCLLMRQKLDAEKKICSRQ